MNINKMIMYVTMRQQDSFYIKNKIAFKEEEYKILIEFNRKEILFIET